MASREITVTMDEREARALKLASVSVTTKGLEECGLTKDDWQSGRQKLRDALDRCEKCDGDGGYRVTSGRIIGRKRVETTRWVKCDRCSGTGSARNYPPPDTPQSNQEAPDA